MNRLFQLEPLPGKRQHEGMSMTQYGMQILDHERRPGEEWRPGVNTRMRVSAVNGAAQLCIFEQWCDPGCGAPTHLHAVEEVLTVLEGQAEIWIEDERNAVSAGQSVIVPAGRHHGFRNTGTVKL